MQAIRLLIVEDHPILADALRLHVQQLLPRAECLLAHDLATGLQMLEQHSPIALVVLDLNLPDSIGLDTLNTFCMHRAEGPLMVFSSDQTPSLIQACLSSRVSYVHKSVELPELMANLLQKLSEGVALHAHHANECQAAPVKNELALLSKQQILVLSQLAHGKSCAEIALYMHITETTVRSHLHTIYQRLGVRNKSQASSRYWLWAGSLGHAQD